jgi:hypothetical protein
MKQAARAFLALALVLVASAAFPADFLLDGRSLGSPEALACETSRVVRHQEVLEASGIVGLDFPSAECDVHIDGLPGLVPAGRSRLWFWKGRLIRMIVAFDRVPLTQAAAFRTALVDLYGHPDSQGNARSKIDTWHSQHTRLRVEWMERAEPHVAVYLVDEDAWAEYQRAREHAIGLARAVAKQRHGERKAKLQAGAPD